MAFSRELLKSGSGLTFVFEDLERPRKNRLIAVAETFFAHDWLLREAKTVFPPFLPLRILEKWQGGCRPFLTPEEALKAHSHEGLNVVVLHWGVDPDYDHGDYLKIIEFVSQSFEKLLSQHRLKEFLEEVYGEFERDRLITFGCSVVRDYREILKTQRFSRPIGKGHPYLMNAIFPKVKQKRKKMETMVGKLSMLGPPRFLFKLNEQEVLKKALQGQTDEEIAKELDLSVIAIKKRWEGIYEKVEAVDPDLLSGAENEELKKSKQKRRYLLALLKDHPEEFWPNPKPCRSKKE